MCEVVFGGGFVSFSDCSSMLNVWTEAARPLSESLSNLIISSKMPQHSVFVCRPLEFKMCHPCSIF